MTTAEPLPRGYLARICVNEEVTLLAAGALSCAKKDERGRSSPSEITALEVDGGQSA